MNATSTIAVFMLALNLPTVTLRIKTSGEKQWVFDPLRKRYVALTPEEWVRQHFVSFLIESLAYPASLIGNEISLTVGNRRKRRCDSVIYKGGVPVMIIEYKAPTIPLTESVFEQAARYNMALHVDYLLISNGRVHYCCKVDYLNNRYEFLPRIPLFSEL